MTENGHRYPYLPISIICRLFVLSFLHAACQAMAIKIRMWKKTLCQVKNLRVRGGGWEGGYITYSLGMTSVLRWSVSIKSGSPFVLQRNSTIMISCVSD